MVLPVLSPLSIRLGQLLVGIATAMFVGIGFMPPRYRAVVGWVVTACYVLGAGILTVYVFCR